MAKLLQTKKRKKTLCYRVRAALGYTQVLFAEVMCVHENSIVNWESGKKPSAWYQRELEDLARKYGVKL